jgi:hypothetical protein
MRRRIVEQSRAAEDDASASPTTNRQRRITVGKYALAWLLGVPGIVLVLIYFFMH